MVLIIAVAMVGLPSHRLLARGFDFVSDPAGEVSRSIVDLAILRNASRDRVGKKVWSLDCWIEGGARKPLVGVAGIGGLG